LGDVEKKISLGGEMTLPPPYIPEPDPTPDYQKPKLNETAKFSTTKAVIILVIGLVFSCFAARVGALLWGDFGSFALWLGLLLIGLVIYWRVPFLRYGFLVLMIVPLVLFVISVIALSSVSP
jgi:hypothetical protein